MVYPISKNKNISTADLEKQIPYPHNFQFGFESYRSKLWGSKIMQEMGCQLIYSLKDGDIYAFDDDLKELKRELNVILDNLKIIEDVFGGGIDFRVQNAIEAVKVAEQYKDVGVYIG
ncbi:hypothetical protein GZH47_00140 [Paenibacillus rhizovicinus]|uniref:Uncharacterized protein n=1 Tax=Paenibacillus rhizovicinus TaxID=2704463 RepID=A0A6C0NY41_9BACL|nr:hypothetical protein [Paenibacillus rhizovicinus]QHW29392.1 hypothetical protein GZH47_00140 [Paenibacillus rhizovicinus]